MIYEIQFFHGEQSVFATAQKEFARQEEVMVKTPRGKLMGRVLRVYEETLKEVDSQILGTVLEADRAQVAVIEEDSKDAKLVVKQLVESSGLQMTVETVAYTLDKSQLFISFTADKRVDFRQLLRDLADTFHTRIELRQIGVRDAAKIFGGLGPCGRPLCCSTFLYEFPAVSIKMLKNQQLSMNQAKNNGLCGRLKCCLSYENDFYKEASRDFPDFGDRLETPDGNGRVIGMNILNRTIKLRYEDFVREYTLEELAAHTTD